MSQPGSKGLGGYCLASDCESNTHTPPCSPPGTYERLSGRHSHPHDTTGTGHAKKKSERLSCIIACINHRNIMSGETFVYSLCSQQ